MISREQYLKALETIDLYHRQNEKKEKIQVSSRILIEDWLDCLWLEGYEPSVRLVRALKYHSGGANFTRIFTYIDDVTEKKMNMCRNVGKKTWQEFQRLLKATENLAIKSTLQ